MKLVNPVVVAVLRCGVSVVYRGTGESGGCSRVTMWCICGVSWNW